MIASCAGRLVLLALASLLAACATSCPCPHSRTCAAPSPCQRPAPSPRPTPSPGPRLAPCARPVAPAPAPAFDREVARRAVFVAVLEQLHRYEDTRRFVVNPTLAPEGVELEMDADEGFARLAPADSWMVLPDGRRMLRPGLKDVDAGLLADWVAHTTPTSVPRDLSAALPIEWFTEADWKALRTPSRSANGDELDGEWDAFHRLHPHSSGWITLSDVGFSADGSQALLQTTSGRGGLDGSGSWVLLKRVDGRWTVAETHMSWVA